MITYNDLYEYLRKERYSEQLQPLPRKIASEVSSYISEKKKIVSEDSDGFSEEIFKIKKQVENSTSIFKELMLLRKKKLLNLAFVASETGINKRDFQNMLEFEKELFDNIISSIEYLDKTIAAEFLNNVHLPEEQTTKLVLFLEDVEELIGPEGKTLGPYKKDDIITLPKQIAEILVEDKKAEIILED